MHARTARPYCVAVLFCATLHCKAALGQMIKHIRSICVDASTAAPVDTLGCMRQVQQQREVCSSFSSPCVGCSTALNTMHHAVGQCCPCVSEVWLRSCAVQCSSSLVPCHHKGSCNQGRDTLQHCLKHQAVTSSSTLPAKQAETADCCMQGCTCMQRCRDFTVLRR
jgi:hypothetical protein